MLAAKERGDEVEILRAQAKLESYKGYITELTRVWSERINIALAGLNKESSIFRTILLTIQHIAVNGNYLMIFDINDYDLFWFSQESDVTDEVISQLKIIQRESEH